MPIMHSNMVWLSELDARSFLQEDIDQYAALGLSGTGIWQDGELVGGIFFFPIEQMIKATKIACFLSECDGWRTNHKFVDIVVY